MDIRGFESPLDEYRRPEESTINAASICRELPKFMARPGARARLIEMPSKDRIRASEITHAFDPCRKRIQHVGENFRILAAGSCRDVKGMIGVRKQLQCRTRAE